MLTTGAAAVTTCFHFKSNNRLRSATPTPYGQLATRNAARCADANTPRFRPLTKSRKWVVEEVKPRARLPDRNRKRSGYSPKRLSTSTQIDIFRPGRQFRARQGLV